jgi:nitrous oxide reductase accessory protein NosL
MKRIIVLFSALFLIIISSCNKKADTIPAETQEISEPDAPVADTVTETPTPKLERPEKTVIETAFDTKLLFKTWVIDPAGPHADFILSKKSFYVVDYDGDGDMPYILNGNKLTIYYEDHVQEADIISVSKSNLVLKWKDVEEPTTYVVWKG